MNILKRFHRLGVLGMNSRIGRYMLPHNPRENYPRVDDKVVTARLASAFGIAMPENYMVFETFGGLRGLGRALEPYGSFVIKPARGSMGNGIIVITGRNGDTFIRADGGTCDLRDLRYHMAQILSGLYSLSAYPDRVIVQHLIRIHPVFEPLAVNGVPDIRVIVFKGFPVMAMTRLPTAMSGGRANLHQGAIGAGIDLATGRTTHAVFRNRIITHHPETGAEIAGHDIPGWSDILTLAVRGFDMTGLGYLGVDVALDADKGPMVLEMNARPGLSIQLANLAGLKKRLDLFARISPEGLGPEQHVMRSLEIISGQ